MVIPELTVVAEASRVANDNVYEVEIQMIQSQRIDPLYRTH